MAPSGTLRLHKYQRHPGTPAWQVDMVTATAGDHSTLLYAAPDAVCYAGTTPFTVSLLR